MKSSFIHNKFKRTLRFLPGLCFASALLFCCSLTAHAARETATVKNSILNVRTEASTSSSIRCKLSQGTKVTILSETTGTDGMKWYNVYFAYNNDAWEGYVRADLVRITGTGTTTSSGTGSSTASASNLRAVRPNAAIVRTSATTSSAIKTRLYKGTIVSVTSEQLASDNYKWSKVVYYENGSSKEGYIRSDLLTAAPAGAVVTGSTSGTSDTSSNPTEGTRKYINTNVAIVRSYASTNGDIRTRLVRGTQVTVVKTVTGSDDQRTWYKVSYTANGSTDTGYIRGDLLTDSTSSETSGNTTSSESNSATNNTSTQKAATIIPTVANIRSYASTNGDIRSKLSHGTAVTILSETTGDDSQKWYKISYTINGTIMQGYVRGDLVTLSSASTETTNKTENTQSTENKNNSNTSGTPGVAQVLSYASPNADVRATLPNGTKVSILKEVTGDDGEKWSKIRFTLDGNQVEGYVKSSILK